jgi:protocatechuate 3,4-dioxygenase beta subunit
MSPSQQLLAEVRALHASMPDARQRELMQSLLTHLHQFATAVRLTRAEWLAGLAFLNRIGQCSTADRDEFMLLSDVLGLSSQIDVLHQPPASTAGTVLGPYYLPDAPQRSYGASVIDTDDGGERLTVAGKVYGQRGVPLTGAKVDVWSCASNGLYPAQDSRQARSNLRGLFTTDQRGRYEFVTLRPTNYSVPTDGPVGELLRLTQRSPQRAAHVHLIVSAGGHLPLVTHLFDRQCPFLASDAVFSVRPSLVREFEPAGERAWRVQFDISLAPEPNAAVELR